MYIVIATEDGKKYEYEYSCINHAREQYNQEKHASLIEYTNEKYHLMECK